MLSVIPVTILACLLSVSSSNVPIVFQHPTCPAVNTPIARFENISMTIAPIALPIPKVFIDLTPKTVQVEEEEQATIHYKSLYIARVFAQLIVLLIAVNVVTLEFEEEFELHRAREVRLVPLRSRPMQVSYDRLDNTATTSQQTEC